MFSFPLLKGDLATALMDPQNVVITEKIAEKYFQGEDPMGKTLSIQVSMMAGLVGPGSNGYRNS